MDTRLPLALAAIAVALAPGLAWSQAYGMGKFDERGGEAMWKNVCQGCHMPDARGAVGAGHYPALAGDPRLASATYPAVVLLKGQKGMPGFGSMMSDDQVADTVNYLRSNFGNHYKGMITAAQVAALRSQP